MTMPNKTQKKEKKEDQKMPKMPDRTTMVKLEKFKPNPYQPKSRVEVTEETARQFGNSILQHGLLQMPIARFVMGEGKASQDRISNGYYEIADGWLRLAGFRWLVKNGNQSFKEMPVAVRELTDQQMADMVMETNAIRHDLNDIELAIFYKRYLEDFKITQAELARRHNCSQGEIANSIRLLELPAPIKQKISSGELPATHGLQLLRINKLPKEQEDLANRCQKQKMSVSNLSEQIDFQLWDNSKPVDPKAERWGERPAFDLKECQNCEFKVKASRPYGGGQKEDRCINVECWSKKQTAAIQAKTKETKEALKKEGKGEKILTREDVTYGQYETIDPRLIDNPGECDKCSKTAMFKYDMASSEKPVKICLDPDCYRKKKTKQTRESNKLKKLEDQDLTLKLGKMLRNANTNPRGCMVVLAKYILPVLDATCRQDMLLMFEDLPKLQNGRLDIDTIIADLNSKSLDWLLNVTIAAQVTISRRRGVYEGYSTELKHDQLRDIAIITNTLDKFIKEVTKFQEANCQGCQYAKEQFIGTGEECCQYIYYKQLDDKGVCINRRQVEKPQPAEEEKQEAKPEAKQTEKEVADKVAEKVAEKVIEETEKEEKEEKPIVYISDEQLSAYAGAKNPLAAFQNANCPGCYFAIKERIGTGDPCCVADDVINVKDGKCLTRRSSKDKD